jgi:hypothetical protein
MNIAAKRIPSALDAMFSALFFMVCFSALRVFSPCRGVLPSGPRDRFGSYHKTLSESAQKTIGRPKKFATSIKDCM